MLSFLLAPAVTALAGGDSELAEAETNEAAETVLVALESGEVLVAAVDGRTDRQTLWLRFDRPTAVLYRSLDWDRVSRIEHQGRKYSGASLHSIVATASSTRRTESSDDEPGETPPAPRNVADVGAETYAELAHQALSPQVHSVALDAWLVNWDADTELDGLALCVTTLDGYGHPVAISGTVTANLLADRRSRLKPQLPQRAVRLESIGRWTRVLPYGRGGEAIYLLPFQAIHPEFDPAVGSFGLVQVTVALAGRGVFYGSVTDVPIRQLGSIRHQLLGTQGSRFLTSERTSLAR